MTYGEIAERLTADAEALYLAMVEAHLAAAGGNREFLGARYGAGFHLMWTGNSSFAIDPVDESALHDLTGYGLVRRTRYTRRGDAVYDIPGQSLDFHRFLRSMRGAPVETVERSARAAVTGEPFAASHPSVAAHLADALELLWTDGVDDGTVTRLGAHLRSAVIDLVNALSGDVGEEVPNRLRSALGQLSGEGRIEEREAEVLVDLAKACQHLNQRLTHIRDEVSRGRPRSNWNEMRRATHLTITLCYELSSL